MNKPAFMMIGSVMAPPRPQAKEDMPPSPNICPSRITLLMNMDSHKALATTDSNLLLAEIPMPLSLPTLTSLVVELTLSHNKPGSTTTRAETAMIREILETREQIREIPEIPEILETLETLEISEETQGTLEPFKDMKTLKYRALGPIPSRSNRIKELFRAMVFIQEPQCKASITLIPIHLSEDTHQIPMVDGLTRGTIARDHSKVEDDSNSPFVLISTGLSRFLLLFQSMLAQRTTGSLSPTHATAFLKLEELDPGYPTLTPLRRFIHHPVLAYTAPGRS